MQVGKVLSFKRCNKLLVFFKTNKYIIILTLFFLFGLFYSVYLFKDGSSVKSFFERYISEVLLKREGKGFIALLTNSFFSFLLFLLFSFCFGSGLLGVIFVPLIISTVGFIYGNLASVLYFEFSLLGISFFTVIILPSAVIFIITLIFSAKESMRFSLKLVKLTLPAPSSSNLYAEFKGLCKRYLLFAFFTFIAAVVETFISQNFLSRFSLF